MKLSQLSSGVYLTILLALFSASNVQAGEIQVCVYAEGTSVPIENATVYCYDDDWLSNDDLMSEGVTGSDGCVDMTYRTYKYKWWSCDG